MQTHTILKFNRIILLRFNVQRNPINKLHSKKKSLEFLFPFFQSPIRNFDVPIKKTDRKFVHIWYDIFIHIHLALIVCDNFCFCYFVTQKNGEIYFQRDFQSPFVYMNDDTTWHDTFIVYSSARVDRVWVCLSKCKHWHFATCLDQIKNICMFRE